MPETQEQIAQRRFQELAAQSAFERLAAEGVQGKEPVNYSQVVEDRAQRPRTFAEHGPAEGRRVLTNLATGVGTLAKEGVTAINPQADPMSRVSAQQNLLHMGKEMVMRPVRELGGIPQPGEDPARYRPFRPGERPFAAIGTALGAEPERVRELEAQGDTGAANAARLFPVVTSLGMSGAARGLGGTRVPNVPKSLKQFGGALGTSEAAQSLYRTPNAPSPKSTIGSLVRDIKDSFKVWKPEVKTEFPVEHLFRRITEMKQGPKGLSRPFDIRNLEDVNWATSEFLRNSENVYNMAVKQQERAPVAARQKLAAEFRNHKERVVDPQSASQTVLDYNNALEQAALAEEAAAGANPTMTLGDLDAARRIHFKKTKNPFTEALKERSQAEMAIEAAKEDVYRGLVYDELGRITGKGDYWRNLKRDQSLAMNLQELLFHRIPELTTKGMQPHNPLANLVTTYWGGGGPRALVHADRTARAFFGSEDRLTPKKAGKMTRKAFKQEPRFPMVRNTLTTGATQTAGQLNTRLFPTLPTAEAAPQEKSLADRNNNPLNIKGPNGEFLKFVTPEQGWQHALSDLQTKVTGGSAHVTPDAPLSRLIEVWAPADDNNDPATYARFVSERLGVPPDTPISQLSNRLPELAQVMAEMEGWSGVPVPKRPPQ